MNSFLIVEDEDFKRQSLIKFIRDEYDECVILTANSVVSAKVSLTEGKFDLVLLDMSLPTYDIGPGESGGRAQNYGGREVIRYIRRKKIQTEVIVVTLFEAFGEGKEYRESAELQVLLSDEYPNIFKGLIYFDAEGLWKSHLKKMIASRINQPCQ